MSTYVTGADPTERMRVIVEQASFGIRYAITQPVFVHTRQHMRVGTIVALVDFTGAERTAVVASIEGENVTFVYVDAVKDAEDKVAALLPYAVHGAQNQVTVFAGQPRGDKAAELLTRAHAGEFGPVAS